MTPIRIAGRSLLIAAVFATVTSAQTGSLAGVVRDAATRQAIEGALVRVAGTSYGTFSRANGTFTVFAMPPGKYSVAVSRMGFTTRTLTGITVQIGRTQSVSVTLQRGRRGSADSVEADPLAANFDGAVTTIDNAQLGTIPALNLSAALGVNGGYSELPLATTTIALSDLYRGVTRVPSIRGARPEATAYLVDGIAVNNPVYGTPPLFVEPLTLAGVTVMPAHSDAEAGGAIAGLVMQSIREGTSRMRGTFEYQSTALASRLGSEPDVHGSTYAARGYLAGPMPFARDAFTFMIGGQLVGERTGVFRLDTGGWHASGDAANSQVVAKLAYALNPRTRVTVTTVGQYRAVSGVDPAYLVPDTSRLGGAPRAPGIAAFLESDSIAHARVRESEWLVIARIEHQLSSGSISASVGSIQESRQTCSIWQGVCVADRLARIPIDSEMPGFPVPRQTPYSQTGQYFGGEQYHSSIARVDLAAQLTDHHLLRAGLYFTRHAIDYRDVIGYRYQFGTVLTAHDVYRASPVEFATYVQDAIEHDLLTVHIGFRFDYGTTGGMAFTNPRDPTNGTTAREVCDGIVPGISETPWTYDNYSGLAACFRSPLDANGHATLIDSAARIAQQDDFVKVRARAMFSPRIALSFPLSETSGMFLNVGRFVRHPTYHDAFRNTGTGSRAGVGGDGDDMCDARSTRPGSAECAPNMLLDRRLAEFVGNPDLSFEVSEGFEAGFASRVKPDYVLEMSTFSGTQSHLPQLSELSLGTDIGLTYGPLGQGSQRTVLSTGSISTFGVSTTLRRRRVGPLAYSVNYTWERSTEIGGPPDVVAEALTAGEALDDAIERASSRARAHTINALLTWQWTERTPRELGPVGSVLLRHSRTSLSVSASAGRQLRGVLPDACAANRNTCAALESGVAGTGTLANLLFVRTLNTHGAQWALILHARNLLDVDDGTARLDQVEVRRRSAARAQAPLKVPGHSSFRRLLAGMNVTF